MPVPALKWDVSQFPSGCLVVLARPQPMSDTRARHHHGQNVRPRNQCCSKDLSEESRVAFSTSVLLERCIRAIRAGIADMAPGCSVPGCIESCVSDTTNTPCMHVRECLGGSQACRQSWARCGRRQSAIGYLWRDDVEPSENSGALRLRLKETGIDNISH